MQNNVKEIHLVKRFSMAVAKFGVDTAENEPRKV